MPLHNFTLIRTQPERSRALGSNLEALIEPALAEPGCLGYAVFQSIDDENLWIIHSNWNSVADLDAHLNQPYMLAFLEELPKWADSIDMYPMEHRLGR